uniref:Uncharacterized protein n=1 Tax=Macrostomum lignano TaxID=282301 RepID=A0A1I8FIJ7_9PLAT
MHSAEQEPGAVTDWKPVQSEQSRFVLAFICHRWRRSRRLPQLADSRSEETVSVGSGKELWQPRALTVHRKEGTVLIMPAESGNGQRAQPPPATQPEQKNSEETKLGQVVFRWAHTISIRQTCCGSRCFEPRDLVSCDRQKDFVDPFITLSLEPPIDSKERQTSLAAQDQLLEGHRLRLLVQDFDKFSRMLRWENSVADLGSIDVTSEPEVVGSLRSVDEATASCYSHSASCREAEKLTIGHLLHGLSVEVAVLDKDLLGQDATIGSVRLGKQCRLSLRQATLDGDGCKSSAPGPRHVATR